MKAKVHFVIVLLLLFCVNTLYYAQSNDIQFKIIVARYKEDIEWLHPVLEHCIIFNKGPEQLNLPNEVSLPNIGRDSETYLRYIIENYDRLPDVVVFTQAYIADHRHYYVDHNYLLRLKDEAIKHNISIPTLVFYQNRDKPDHRWDPDWNIPENWNNSWFSPATYYENKPITYYEFFIRHIHPIYPNPFRFLTNAIFAVRKELILSRPISYYEYLHQFIAHHINPTEGHFIEKSWYYIFHPEYSMKEWKRTIAKSPWERCRDTLHALPRITSTPLEITLHFIEMAILTCGLYPYNQTLFENLKIPSDFRAYSELGNSVGLKQYPNQFARFLLHLRPFPVTRFVEIGSNLGGSFVITAEYLKYMNGGSDSGLHACLISKEALGKYSPTTQANMDEYIDSYSNNILSYLSYHPMTSFVQGDFVNYLHFYADRIIDVLFVDCSEFVLVDNTFSTVAHSSFSASASASASASSSSSSFVNNVTFQSLIQLFQEAILVSKVLTFSHIVDMRYPQIQHFWQQVTSLYPPAQYQEFVDQYIYVYGEDAQYYGIGVLLNPIFYQCEYHAPNVVSCKNTTLEYQCYHMIDALSSQSRSEHVAVAALTCGLDVYAVDLEEIYAYLPQSLLYALGENLDRPLGLHYPPNQISQFLAHMKSFPVVSYVHFGGEMGKKTPKNYRTYGKTFVDDGDFTFFFRYFKKRSSELRSVIFASSPFSTENQTKVTLIQETVRVYPDSLQYVQGDINSFFKMYPESAVDLIFLSTNQKNYEQLRDEFNRLSRIANMLVLPFIVDYRFPDVVRFWEELKATVGLQCYEFVDQYSGTINPLHKKYFGIGLFINPSFLMCEYTDTSKDVIKCVAPS